MKTNQKIIFLVGVFVLLIAIILGIYFGIDKSSTLKNTNSNQNKENTQNYEDIKIIENEINTIINYLNNKVDDKTSPNVSCIMLSSDIGFNLNSNQDFFITYAAPIMECVYNFNYTHINLTPITEQIIISPTEEKTLREYFKQDFNLKSLDEVFEITENTETSKYFNQGYKILTEYYSGPGIPSITYKVSRIIKVNDSYEVTLIATQNKIEYIGTVQVNIIDNHCQFDKLIFKKATN